MSPNYTICQIIVKDGKMFYINCDSEEKPFGAVDKFGLMYVMLPNHEDARNECDHCGGIYCFGFYSNDNRCGRCRKTNPDL